MDQIAGQDAVAKTAWMTKPRFAMGLSIAAALILLTLGWTFLPVKEWIALLATWAAGLGIKGAIAFAAIYIVVVVSMAPASLMTLAAGLTYGAWGFPLAVISATVGATLAFLISRTVLREKVKSFTLRRPLLMAVDQALQEEGWRTIVLVRLSPLVPFNVQNYFFGATDVKFIPYVVSTFCGIMPGTALYVYLGTIGHAAATGSFSVPSLAILVAGLAASVAVVMIIGRKAKAKLNQIGASSGIGHATNPAPVLIQSTITCPHCGAASSEPMSLDSCQIRYECKSCGQTLKPRTGDCCVFCSYGSTPCPPIQKTRSTTACCS